MDQDNRVSEDQNLLDRLYIAAPCNVDWNSMTGDERIRFCGLCKKNVYNISEMTRNDAASFIRESEGKACIRMYKRKDGTVITDNCPVGLRKLRNKTRAAIVACTSILAWLSPENAQAQGDPSIESGFSNQPPYSQIMGGDIGINGQESTDLNPTLTAAACRVPPSNEPFKSAVIASTLLATALGAFVAWKRKKASLWMLGSIVALILVSAGLIWGLSGGILSELMMGSSGRGLS